MPTWTTFAEPLRWHAAHGRGVLWTYEDGHWHARILERHRKPGAPAVAFLGATPVTAGWDARIYRWSLDGQFAGSYDIPEVGVI
jgi:hypothetical protein